MKYTSQQRGWRSFIIMFLLLCLPIQAGPGHEAEAYSFAFHNFDSSDDLPWSSTPSWALYRDTFLAIPPEHDPLSNLFEFAFYELLYKEEIGKTGNCYGISLLSLLLNKKGAHLSVCGVPSQHSGDLEGHYIDKEGGMGKPDLFLGDVDGSIDYFEQVSFDPKPGDNPMGETTFASGARPTFVNVDGDGDWDLFVGLTDGSIRYFENVGTSKSPLFSEHVNELNPLNITGAGPLTLEFADMDGDRDPDVFVSEGNGNIRYFKNVGTYADPVFEEQLGEENPFDDINDPGQAVLRLIDSDSDGDLDGYIGAWDGTVHYYENQAGNYVARTGDQNPADSVNVSGNAAPFFADYNGDGVLDLFVGASDGTVSYYLNTGGGNNPHFTLQNAGANPMNGLSATGQAVPFLIDINDEDNDDQIERMGPTDPLVRYTVNRLHGHQVNLATLQYFADYFLSLKSLDGRHAYNDFLDNQAKGVGTILSITKNFEGDGGHAIVPYKAETKAASAHSAEISIKENKLNVIEITGGADEFDPQHEHATINIPGAGPGGAVLEARIVRVDSDTKAVINKEADGAVTDESSTWSLPERHLIYVYDSNFPYQNPKMRLWYESNQNVVMIDTSNGKWYYRKNTGTTIWPEGDNGHITIMPETVTTPMDRTPVSMGLDMASLALQVVIHNDGAKLVQVTDGEGKRMFVPGTRQLDADPKTGLRSIAPVIRFDGDTSGNRQVYMLWGRQPEELYFEVEGPEGYELDIASKNQRVRLKASAVQGKNTLVMKRREKATQVLDADQDATYQLEITHLTKPGHRAETLELEQLTMGGSIQVTKAKKGRGFTIAPINGQANYQLRTEIKTKQGSEQETFGHLSQKSGTLQKTTDPIEKK